MNHIYISLLPAHNALGLKPGASRTLVEGFEKDRTRFDKFAGTEADLEAELGLKKKVNERLETASTQFVTTVQQSTAAIADAFLESWYTGLMESSKYNANKFVSEMQSEYDKIWDSDRGNKSQ